MVRYECPFCGLMRNTTAAIKFHMENEHGDKLSDLSRANGPLVDLVIKCYIFAPAQPGRI